MDCSQSESAEKKISIILKWIFGSISCENYLSGSDKIKNIIMHLERMKFNGYLRLFEIDLFILKSYMTENSWIMYNDFKEKHREDAWKCPQCSNLFSKNAQKYQCVKCLFWYHEKCSPPRNFSKQSSTNVSMCTCCFFSLES